MVENTKLDELLQILQQVEVNTRPREKSTDHQIKNAVNRIIYDIEDRRGIKNAWDDIDSDVKDEIFKTWCDIIEEAIK